MRTINRVEDKVIVNSSSFNSDDNVHGITVYKDEIYTASFNDHLVSVYNLAGTLQRSWGTAGNGDGEFNGLHSIRVFNDEVYVTDRANHRVQVFNLTGTFQRKWGTIGGGDGQFFNTSGIHIFNSEVYVSELGADRVQVFNTSGTFQRKWGSNGSGNGQFDDPADIFDDGTSIFVVDNVNDRVQKFSTTGTFQAAFGSGDFSFPHGLCVVGDEVHVTDGGNNDRIAVYDTSGNFKRFWGVGDFNEPIDIWNAAGLFYIAATGSDKIHVVPFQAPTKWYKYGSRGTKRQLAPSVSGTLGPALTALDNPIPQASLLTGEHYAPMSIALLRDMREAIVRLAVAGNITNKITGNAITWEDSGTNDLYFSAMKGKRSAFGATDGDTFIWTRTLGQCVADGRMRDIDIGEAQLCAEFMEASLAT